MISQVLGLIIAIGIAFLVGKGMTKLRLPAILGWLLAGMLLGPFGFALVNGRVTEAFWYEAGVKYLECAVGLLIGTELVFRKIKKTGKQIIVTTLTQSLGTFVFVTLVFAVIFFFTGIPLYLAVVFGGIALATAPAPALSIVREFKTKGPVTETLIPMAALDDMVAVVVFFTSISFISAGISEQSMPAYLILLVVLLPVIIGAVIGLLASVVLKKDNKKAVTIALILLGLLFAFAIGFVFNYFVLPRPVLNFMLIGMSFAAVFANLVSDQRLEQIISDFNPVLGLVMLVVIFNLGSQLDYHLILGAGMYTVVYIAARAIGKYSGAYFGASITKSPQTVKRYLGFTLLPHSGVSLVFTGIAVSVLAEPAPECAAIVQGTIAAAAVINELIAVIMAKKGFEWAGEFEKNTAAL